MSVHTQCENIIKYTEMTSFSSNVKELNDFLKKESRFKCRFLWLKQVALAARH